MVKQKRKGFFKRLNQAYIQALNEGQDGQFDYRTGLYNFRVNDSGRLILDYQQQVEETHLKYQGQSAYGNTLTRSIVDTRSAFIAGEGIKVEVDDPVTEEFINKFIDLNGLKGSKFIRMVKGSEFAGKVITQIQPNKDTDNIRLVCTPDVIRGRRFFIENFEDIIQRIYYKVDDVEKNLNLVNTTLIVTGGDGYDLNNTTTKTGVALWDIEAYDKGEVDLRKINNYGTRITPYFKTATSKETTDMNKILKESGWSMGDAVAGMAEFDIKGSPVGPIQSLILELQTTIKTISAITGIPVHWMGYTDLLSNRSTSESLLETMNNATELERDVWAEKVKEIIVKAQIMAINNDIGDIRGVNKDFKVSIPMMSVNTIKERIDSMSVAFNDKVISAEEYRSVIPDISPNLPEEKETQNVTEQTE